MKKIKISSIFIFSILVLSISVSARDLKPEEVVAKHLSAIGSQTNRDALKTLMAIGFSEYETKVPAVKGGGRAIVVSDASNLFFAMGFNSKDYPAEKIGYFNGKQSLPYISPGLRSVLGSFISEHDKLLADGLFGGSLSLRWALLNANNLKARMTSGGTKTIGGKNAQVINFFSPGSGSSNFTVKLYFDAETFHHIRTEYYREIPAKTPVFGRQNQIASTSMTLTENFSDFKSVDGVTLPFVYRVDFMSNGASTVYESSWGIKVAQYSLNQKLEPDFFTFDPKQS